MFRIRIRMNPFLFGLIPRICIKIKRIRNTAKYKLLLFFYTLLITILIFFMSEWHLCTTITRVSKHDWVRWGDSAAGKGHLQHRGEPYYLLYQAGSSSGGAVFSLFHTITNKFRKTKRYVENQSIVLITLNINHFLS